MNTILWEAIAIFFFASILSAGQLLKKEFAPLFFPFRVDLILEGSKQEVTKVVFLCVNGSNHGDVPIQLKVNGYTSAPRGANSFHRE